MNIMIFFRNFFSTPDKLQLLYNFFALSGLQILNYLLPLLTLPYLVRVLGVEQFGLLAFVSATIAYFSIIIDYGFNLTAPREISIHRDNKEKINEIFSVIISIKIGLILFSLPLLILLILHVDLFFKDKTVYFLSFASIIGDTFFPIWFFQGVERMKYITYLNILSKFIFTFSIFLFIKQPSDIYKIPIITTVGNFIAGIWSLIIINRKFGICFRRQEISVIWHYLCGNWHVFISNVAINLYTTSATFILGLFTNNTIVGYFSAADKIMQAFKAIVGTVSQVFYPYVSRKLHYSKKNNIYFIKKLILYISVASGVLSLLIFLFSDLLINIILGEGYKDSSILLKIMAFLPLMVGLSNIFGVHIMLTFGKKEAFSKILITGAIIGIFLSLLLVPLWQHIGTAIILVLVESFITITMFVYVKHMITCELNESGFIKKISNSFWG